MAKAMQHDEDELVRPLSQAELQKYQDVLDSESFKDMVHFYHADAAISSIRMVLLKTFKQGAQLEAVLAAVANVWLDCVARVEPLLNDQTMANWQRLPHLLVQILLQQAVDVLNRPLANIRTDYNPELEELYKEWKAAMPAPITSDEQAVLDVQHEQAKTIYQNLTIFRSKVENSGLELKELDYIEVWSLIVLQIYIFGYLEKPDFYYVLDTNWNLYLKRLGEIISLLVAFTGYESLLLPENRAKLDEFMQTEEYQSKWA